MLLLRCERCGDMIRSLTAVVGRASETDEALEEFHATHRGCPIEIYTPTGPSQANGPWHDPMTVRRIEVHGKRGFAVAVGSRHHIDGPLCWQLEQGRLDLDARAVLDRPLYWLAIDKALYPSHLPVRALEAWATQIENFVGSASPEAIVLLDDDPARPDSTFACLTLTARTHLEHALVQFGFDAGTLEKLVSIFEEPFFPPLRVERRLSA